MWRSNALRGFAQCGELARRCHEPRVHDQRTEHRGDHGMACRDVPAGQERCGAVSPGGRALCRRPSAGGRGHSLRCSRHPCGADAFDDRLPACARAAGRNSRASATTRRTCSWTPPKATTSSGYKPTPASSSGPNGWAGYEEGVPVLDMGYEFYPAVPGQLPAACLGLHRGAVPLLVTENGIGTTDDDQRIDYVRQALSGVLDVDRRGHRRPGVYVLVAARQLRVGTGLSAPVRHRQRRPHHLRQDEQNRARNGSPRWPRPTPSML